MKRVAMVIFDRFTDIDLFLMWDILARHKTLMQVSILGTSAQHVSYNGLTVNTHDHINKANEADVVLFSSGKGTRTVIQDTAFLQAFKLDPSKQLIGSICSGALILAKLGLLTGKTATTHPNAKAELEAMEAIAVERPLVCHGNIATAGGCLSATYLTGWVVEKLYGKAIRQQVLKEILPVGQTDIFEGLIDSTLTSSMVADTEKKTELPFYSSLITQKPSMTSLNADDRQLC